MPLAPGKTFAWTTGVDRQSIDQFYSGRPAGAIRSIFSEPDMVNGNWVGYNGLNITDAQLNKFGTVWFLIINGKIQQARVEK